MDKREAREYIGTNHHFNPSLNPGTPPKQSWFPNIPTHQRKAQPIQIQRQLSASSDGPSSPTSASPSTTSPAAFSFPKTADKIQHEPKPKIFKEFDFGN